MTLQDALDAWCVMKTAAVFGQAHLRDIGPCLIMSNTMLERIVNCTHYHKISNTQDLKREAGWADSGKYGNDVLDLIKTHGPKLSSPFSVTPLRPSTSSHVNVPVPSSSSTTSCSVVAQRRRNKCGACGQEGHNGRFYSLAPLIAI